MAEVVAPSFDPYKPWALFNADGTPRRLLWCSDDVRRDPSLPCPYVDGLAPCGECCKAIMRPREPFPMRDSDCRYGCCKAGDEGLWSEAVPL